MQFGFRTCNEDMVEQLRDHSKHNKLIKTCPNYEITSNPKYAASFQYTPVEMRDTREEKEGSDMVLKVLKIAYFTQDEQAKLKFKVPKHKVKEHINDEFKSIVEQD